MNDFTMKPPVAARREIPHTVSPGLWTLAWRRLKTDSVAMVSLAIVVAFVLLMILSALGVVASDWSREVGVNYAPPSFVGPDAAPRRGGTRATSPRRLRGRRRAARSIRRSSIRSATSSRS